MLPASQASKAHSSISITQPSQPNRQNEERDGEMEKRGQEREGDRVRRKKKVSEERRDKPGSSLSGPGAPVTLVTVRG